MCECSVCVGACHGSLRVHGRLVAVHGRAVNTHKAASEDASQRAPTRDTRVRSVSTSHGAKRHFLGVCSSWFRDSVLLGRPVAKHIQPARHKLFPRGKGHVARALRRVGAVRVLGRRRRGGLLRQGRGHRESVPPRRFQAGARGVRVEVLLSAGGLLRGTPTDRLGGDAGLDRWQKRGQVVVLRQVGSHAGAQSAEWQGFGGLAHGAPEGGALRLDALHRLGHAGVVGDVGGVLVHQNLLPHKVYVFFLERVSVFRIGW
mmetsp:Transcript_9786/g.18445  ORF Transcript_9786/g.18445 Transcript_9786/m.18445 type:complete len:259 (-) Transcript_9786:318-1094(-)